MVTLAKIDRNNFRDILKLSVFDKQKDYVASNAFSMAQAKVQPECIPLAVYHGDDLIGFVMYCVDIDNNEYWIYRLMIDHKYQGKGYGRAVMQCLLDTIMSDKTRSKVYLSFNPENAVARKLYESMKFIPDGRILYGEVVYCLHY